MRSVLLVFAMFEAVTDSLAVVKLASPLVAFLSVLVFEVPRYLMSTLVVAFVGLRQGITPQTRARISVILPAFNNGACLADTLHSLTGQRATIVDIIIVNEGSSDDTLAIAQDFHRRGIINNILNHKSRTGKSAAINHAARFARGDLLLILDVDTVLSDRDSLAMLAAAFDDQAVAAASGNLMVRNHDQSLWTALQTIEYLSSITAGRSFLDQIDSIACCSGAFSMYRRDVFLSVGGMNVGPGEDLEITLRLRALGYRVRFIADAVALTTVPTRFSRLFRQRLRWDRDALCTRMFMYRQAFKTSYREGLGDTLQRLDFLLFELFPSLFFPFYMIYVISYFGADAPAFFFGLYLYLLGLYTLNLALIVVSTKARLTWFEAAILFLVPFYQGVLMRLVRFYAFVSEIFFNRSRHDDFVPPRVRKALYARARHAAS